MRSLSLPPTPAHLPTRHASPHLLPATAPLLPMYCCWCAVAGRSVAWRATSRRGRSVLGLVSRRVESLGLPGAASRWSDPTRVKPKPAASPSPCASESEPRREPRAGAAGSLTQSLSCSLDDEEKGYPRRYSASRAGVALQPAHPTGPSPATGSDREPGQARGEARRESAACVRCLCQLKCV